MKKIISLKLVRFVILVLSLSFLSSLAEARVNRIEITSRVVVADGMSFGDTGPYEKLQGTLAWVGWEADIQSGLNRLTVQFPIALEEGKPIVERILTEFADAQGASTTPVFTKPLPYEAVLTNREVAQAELRARPSDSPRPSGPEIPDGELIPRSQWSFADCPDGPPGTPSTTALCLAGGFRNDLVYDLRYRATGSPVMGLVYATTRDFVSFLRHAAQDDEGTTNPVPGIDRDVLLLELPNPDSICRISFTRASTRMNKGGRSATGCASIVWGQTS